MIENHLASLIQYALRKNLITQRDVVFIQNQFMALFNLNADFLAQHAINQEITHLAEYPDEILDDIYTYLSTSPNHLYNWLQGNFEHICCYLMGLLTPAPSIVEAQFNHLYQVHGADAALQYFYQLSKDNFYIRSAALKNNLKWSYTSSYGDMQITINLAKPEKDPRQIALLKFKPSLASAYPQCVLCKENEGYVGNLAEPSSLAPARFNHRLITLTLNHQRWFLQYSPYMYYNEHTIIFSDIHRAMYTCENSFLAMFDFVDQFPRYFIGSNADLPIIGGSILNHDHFQGGDYTFPLESATMKAQVSFNKYPLVKAHIMQWPISTIRLVGTRQSLLALANEILCHWRSYSNIKDNIYANTAGINHNGLTFILRYNQTQDNYTLYLMLRNNRTSDTFPDGIFHAHPHLHHIKKENIGLIEAAGLAILPGRLATELAQISALLKSFSSEAKFTINQNLMLHEEWIDELSLQIKQNRHQNSDIDLFLRNEVAKKFVHVLECCAVFQGNRLSSWNDFLQQLDAYCV